MKSIRITIGLFCLFSILSSCSDDSESEERILTRIEIESSNGTILEVGQTTILSVNGFDQEDTPLVVSSPVTWTSSSEAITVDPNGLVSGAAGSNSTITATTQNLEASIAIQYSEEVPIIGYELFVSDANGFGQGPWKILRYDGDGSNPRTFTDENLAWPQDIIILEEEREVLISNLNSGRITKYNLDTGAYIDDFALVAGGPTRMKFGPDGLLYVLQWQGDGTVLRFNRDGSFVDAFTNVGVGRSIGLDWDEDGNLYVSSFEDAFVRKFDSMGQDMGLFIASNLFGPTNIYFMENGNLLVSDWAAGFVFMFSASGQFLGPFITGVPQVEGFAKTPEGNILIGHGMDSSIEEYRLDGTFVQDKITSNLGGLQQPNAIAVRELNPND